MYRSPEEWELFIGQQVRLERLRQNMTQSELASRSGLSTTAVNRLESAKGSSLATFIKVLKVLGMDAWFEQLAPEVAFSPIQQMQLGKQRERASRKSKASRPE